MDLEHPAGAGRHACTAVAGKLQDLLRGSIPAGTTVCVGMLLSKSPFWSIRVVNIFRDIKGNLVISRAQTALLLETLSFKSES